MSKVTDQLEQDYIDGLLAERAGHVQAGTKRKDRVKQVDAELKRVGYDGPLDAGQVDRQAPRAETAAADPVSETATVKSKATPRKATPAEEAAIAATVEATLTSDWLTGKPTEPV